MAALGGASRMASGGSHPSADGGARLADRPGSGELPEGVPRAAPHQRGHNRIFELAQATPGRGGGGRGASSSSLTSSG